MTDYKELERKRKEQERWMYLLFISLAFTPTIIMMLCGWSLWLALFANIFLLVALAPVMPAILLVLVSLAWLILGVDDYVSDTRRLASERASYKEMGRDVAYFRNTGGFKYNPTAMEITSKQNSRTPSE